MKLPAYTRYKSSGVKWLGEVPKDWEVKRLDFLASVKARLGWKGLTASEYVPEGFIFLATPNIKGQGEIDFTNVNYITAERYNESPEIMVQIGDVLMAKDGSTLGTTNVVHHLPAPTTVNSSIAVLRPKPELNSSYFFRWLTSAYLQSVIQIMKDGQGVPHLFQADIKKFTVLLPSAAEQEAIAAFLDRETGRLDRLVAMKQELIERLKEKRTALISRTVTCGLPPDIAREKGLPVNPPLKPSGVPWFDEYPSHWQTKRLRHISDIIVVGVVVNPSSYVSDEGVAFLLGGDVREMRIDTTNCKRCLPESSNGPLVKSRLEAGDLVVVRVGYPGVAAVVPPELAGGNVASMMLVRKHSRYCSQWLAYAFNSQVGRDQVEIVQYGAAQKQFNISHAVDFAFPFPPLPEQIAIAAYLDAETAKLDALVAKVEEAVERLQEYRTALITAAVTGKINVTSL